MLSCAITDTIKKVMQLTHQLPARIAPKMTAVMQLTDTDIAFEGKTDAKREKLKLVREQKLQGLAAGASPNFKVGAEEVMRISKAFHDGTVARNAADKIVLAGSRRNGMLSFRPSLKHKRLVPVELQEWAAQFPFESHRLKTSWTEDRTKFLDDTGKPQLPRWDQIWESKLEAEELERLHCEKQIASMKEQVVKVGDQQIEITIPALELEADVDKVFPENQLHQLLHPKLRKMLQAAKLKDTDKQAKNMQKQLERTKARMATKLLDKEWQSFVGEAQIKMTREEILSTIVPGVGSKKSKKAAQKKVSTVKLR